MRRTARWPYDCRVLIVDEDELSRWSLALVLSRSGASYAAVRGPRQALERLSADPALGVVVVDVDLSEGGPEWLISQIRATRPDIVIVGTGQPENRSLFSACSVERFLPKPIWVEDLILVVEQSDHGLTRRDEDSPSGPMM